MKDLIDRFDAVIRGVSAAHARPTAGSIARINGHFGIELPPALHAFAIGSRSFSSFFASLGPDYDSPAHIIRINSHWHRRRRTRRRPDELVIFTQGFMDDRFWCFDKSAPSISEPGCVVRFWCPEELEYATAPPPDRYGGFVELMKALCTPGRPSP